MQKWSVICWALLALACAEDCPNGEACEGGQTCCSTPGDGYSCCPFHQAECCDDHLHCCPQGTLCIASDTSCVNATLSIPWVERVSAHPPGFSKSFRMIRPYIGEEDDNNCPDQSKCPPEFSCLKALARFGCCPLSQGVSCPDGKHCCPEGHQCSADCRSCIKKDVVSVVVCDDGESECPEETTCCDNPDGTWGCCPMPEAACCEDKVHCCPEGNACDVKLSKCICLTTKKETPMWAKLPARKIAQWEKQKAGEQVTAPTISDGEPSKDVSELAATTASPFGVSTSPTTPAGTDKVPCNDTVACLSGTTCCKAEEGGWACCPLPQAVCCEDFLHCCPHDKKCNLAAQTCDNDSCSSPWVEKVPTVLREAEEESDVACDPGYSCPGKSTCCKDQIGSWTCCPLPEAVCCDDHVHCCPVHTTCDLTTLICQGPSGPQPMVGKVDAFNTDAPSTEATTITPVTSTEEKQKKQGVEEEGRIQCDPHTSCPEHTTCCFMSSFQKWGCCPLPEAVCCADGDHCCPAHYKCDSVKTTCLKGEVEIPWYNKIPAIDSSQGPPESVECNAHSSCPEFSTCCQLSTGQWGCCPFYKAVCCLDMEHCCPQGYSCNMGSASCQKVIMLQLQTLPLTRVYMPQPQLYSSQERGTQCEGEFRCRDKETCCRISPTTWGCCPTPNAVCCDDMRHCCPAGHACAAGGTCTQQAGLRWDDWQVFLSNNKKRALTV